MQHNNTIIYKKRFAVLKKTPEKKVNRESEEGILEQFH